MNIQKTNLIETLFKFNDFLRIAFLIIWFKFAENSFSWLPYQNYILMML